jgi:regulator of sigma E protease
MGWIYGALKVLIVLGTLITIHELGHFLVAKAFKVKVHKFAIGFGPKIFTRKKGETEYTLRLIPFGGFVQMEGEERYSEEEGAFNKKPVWQRILVIAAGATVNIIFALILYFGLSYSKGTFVSPIVGEVLQGSPAEKSGIVANDKIIEINNKRIIKKFDIDEIVQENPGEELSITVLRNNEKVDIDITPMKEISGTIGIYFNNDSTVASVIRNSNAEKSEIKAGDKFIGVNGSTDVTLDNIIDQITNSPNSELSFIIVRNGETITKNVLVDSYELYRLGILCKEVKPEFFERIYYSLDDTTYYLKANIEGIIGFFSGKLDTAQVMGPVGIAKEIGKTEAFSQFIYLMSAISLSLGIFNLMPIPALDGGRILVLVVEGIRRKPLGEKKEIALQVVGFSLIILLAIVVTVQDIVSLVK